MIGARQLKLLERARQDRSVEPERFADWMRRHGGADHAEALTAAGFGRLMDRLTVEGFICRQRPLLSARTIELVRRSAVCLEISDFTYAADIRACMGVSDLRDLYNGQGLIELLTRWQSRGISVEKFNNLRREITPAQVRLVQLARARVEMMDATYYRVLQNFGGVVSSKDLDRRGFDLVMTFMESMGFERQPAKGEKRGYGERPGFATGEQLELIRVLWSEWIGPTPDGEVAIEAGLNAWLERFHRVSSLRFLTKAGAARAITSLKAMKAREAAASKRSAQHA